MTLSLQNQWGMYAFMCLFTLPHKKQNEIHELLLFFEEGKKKTPKNHNPQPKSHKQQLTHPTIQ